jgi:hypothetical protein
MKHIRQIIGHQLIDALHQCNTADLPEEHQESNDLNTKCSRQHEAYGHIADALTSIGFNRAREIYASEGTLDQAHAEIDEQYPTINMIGGAA